MRTCTCKLWWRDNYMGAHSQQAQVLTVVPHVHFLQAPVRTHHAQRVLARAVAQSSAAEAQAAQPHTARCSAEERISAFIPNLRPYVTR